MADTNTYTVTLPAGAAVPDLTAGSVYFVGTATVLIRYAGFTVLTDPNFIHRHEKVSLGYGLHATRLTDPAVNLRDLPPLDLVVLSHFHGDHFDQLVEAELDKSLPIVTNPQAEKELHQRGFGATFALNTWSTLDVLKGDTRLRITAAPGRHGPPLVDLALPDVMGSMLDFETAAGTVLYRIYFSGDTLAIGELKDIPHHYPDIDLALLDLGGTEILGILATMDGKQGVEALRMVHPRMAIPIHYNDYDVFHSPLSDFQREVEEAGLQDRVHYLTHGETYTFVPREHHR